MKKEVNFTPMNGRLMLYPPPIERQTPGGIALTEQQIADRMMQADVVWRVAAIDPTSGLDIKAGDYVFLDIQGVGDILLTELEGVKVYVTNAYAVIAKASESMAEAQKATEKLIDLNPMNASAEA